MRLRLFASVLWPLAALLGVLHANPAAAQSGLEVIEPRNRSAEELLPLLQPLLEPDGSVNVFDNKLVLRATPGQMAQVRQLLGSIDRAPRQLLITVRQGGITDGQRQSAGISGAYRRGDGSIVVPRGDGSVPSRPELELRDERSRSDSGGSQQIRVEEGREAQIMIGQSRPYSSSYRRPDGVLVQRTESFGTASGFSVLPRVQGQQVRLEINARQQLPAAGGAINVQSASSSVVGPLGEWFEIGAAVQQLSQSSTGLLGGSSGSSRREGSILVKVEELR